MIWPNGEVDVCYDPTDGNRPELLKRAREILNLEGWSSVAKVAFVGWGACGVNPLSGGQVRVHFESNRASDKYFGHASASGPVANTFTELYLVDDIEQDPDFVHFRYEVLHEFGHVIGLAYEQERPDNRLADSTYICDEFASGETTVSGSWYRYRTSYFDTQSVMSYCSHWAQALSPGDVAAAQAMYGRREEMWRGQNPSNRAMSVKSSGPAAVILSPTYNAFFVHDDGQLHRMWRYPVFDTWDDDELTSGSWASAPPGASVAAISRKTDTMDVFYVGDSGAVYHASWRADQGWNTTFLPGTWGLATPGSQIAAVSSSPGAMNVFYAGTDGNLWWSYWTMAPQDGARWSFPVAIVDDGSVPPEANVTAVSRNPDRINVFYIDGDGAVHNALCFGSSGLAPCFKGWTPQGSWPHYALGTSGTCGVASTSAGISAVARTPEHIDVFHVNKEGKLCVTPWSSTNGWPYGGGITVSEKGALNATGSVTAIATSPESLDVFFVGPNRLFRRVSWHAPSATALDTTTSGWMSADISDDEYSFPGTELGVIGRAPGFDVFGNARPASLFALPTFSRQWWGELTGGGSWTWRRMN